MVFGTAVEIVIGYGSRAVMQEYVDRMNAQAPHYNHRIRGES